MESNPLIVVGGTLKGKRIVSEPLPVGQAIERVTWMQKQGYSVLTMTDCTTGHDYDIGQIWEPLSWEKH